MALSQTPSANGSTPLTMTLQRSRRAKRYAFIKYSLAIIEIVYLVILLFLFLGLGLSKMLASFLSSLMVNKYRVIPAYILTIFIIYYILGFPLNIYRSFIIEKKFCLSNQKIINWIGDQIKAGILSYIIAIILITAFYYILRRYPNIWWLVISIFWIFFSLILARLTPIIIIPLFFKYKKLTDEVLRQRIINLAQNMKLKILDVFEIDFSKKTLKANAAFVGMGKTKRVILSDTLKEKYTHNEIEVILAHEFAHYRLRHLLKLILINSLTIILAFYLIFKTSNYLLNIFGLSSLSDIAALPIVMIYLIVFGLVMQPFQNYISRNLERNADMLALKVTGLKDDFISMMEKLSAQNLADRNPSTLIKLFFFDHPPVDERIAMAKAQKLSDLILSQNLFDK